MLAISLAIAAVVGARGPERDQGLFIPCALRGGPDRDTPTIRERPVRVRFDDNGGIGGQPGEEIYLNLFDDAQLTALVEAVRFDSGFTVIRGSILDIQEGEFLFIAGRGVLTGEVRGVGHAYEIEPVGDGVHVVREIDDTGWKPCATSHEHEVAGEGHQGGDYGDRTPTIRVLVMYTRTAMDAQGGEAAMQARVVFAINQANTAYANSLATAQLELAFMGVVDYPESGNASTDLSRWRATSDGFMDEVHCIRNAVGADMCALLVNNFNACGIAYLMTNVGPGFASSAFSVTDKDCINGYTFAHELGHNMGCAHDRDNAGSAAYPYAYGYRTPDNVYRTIMAYSPGTRVGRFSNPNIVYNGYVLGVPVGDPAAAYNALCITNTAPVIEQFRGAAQTPADVNCDGSLDGFDIEVMERAVAGDTADFCRSDPDFNQDGSLDGFDVLSVELAVGSGGC
jgi:hypothetical protein